jgi:hypothetical protein
MGGPQAPKPEAAAVDVSSLDDNALYSRAIEMANANELDETVMYFRELQVWALLGMADAVVVAVSFADGVVAAVGSGCAVSHCTTAQTCVCVRA